MVSQAYCRTRQATVETVDTTKGRGISPVLFGQSCGMCLEDRLNDTDRCEVKYQKFTRTVLQDRSCNRRSLGRIRSMTMGLHSCRQFVCVPTVASTSVWTP